MWPGAEWLSIKYTSYRTWDILIICVESGGDGNKEEGVCLQYIIAALFDLKIVAPGVRYYILLCTSNNMY
jgi:hypothetical protein